METRRDADKARAVMNRIEEKGKMRDAIRQEKGRVKSRWRKVMRSLKNVKFSPLKKGDEGGFSGDMKVAGARRSGHALLAASLLICLTLFTNSQEAAAASVTMDPNANGTTGGGWTSSFANLADASDATYAAQSGTTGSILTVNLTNPGLTAADKINSVTVTVRQLDTGGGASKMYIENLPGGPYTGVVIVDAIDGSTITDFSETFVNPGGGNNWTNTHIDAMTAGLITTNNKAQRLYEVSVEVDYTTKAQTLQSFQGLATDQYTPTANVKMAKMRTAPAATNWGYALTSAAVTVNGTLDNLGDIKVWRNTADDFATATEAGSDLAPTVGLQSNISLAGVGNTTTQYLWFTISLPSEALGDYSLTVTSLTGSTADLIPLPKTTQTRSVKPPTQSLDYWYDYARNFMKNSSAPASDILLARIDTNKTSEGKNFGSTLANISGTITPGKVTDITVRWNTVDDFASASVVGTRASPTVGTYYDIPIAGAGKSKGYLYYSIGITDGGTTGNYTLKVDNIKDSKGALVEDYLQLPQASSTSYVTDPYAIQVCGDCHAYPPIDAAATRGDSSGAVLGAHYKHARFNPMQCTTCHGDTTSGETNPAHRNDQIQMPDRAALDISYSKGTAFAQSTSPQPFGTCTPLCHNGITQTWASGATMVCNDCHLTAAGDTDDFTFDYFTSTQVPRLENTEWTGRGHGKPSGNYAYTGNPAASLACANCHDGGIPHGDIVIPFRTNVTGNMDFFCQNCHGTSVEIGSLFTAISTSAKAKNIRTHSQQVFEDVAYKSLTTWRIAALKCIDCHDPHGDNNNSMIHDKVWTGGSNDKGRPDPFVGASTVVFLKETGINAYGMGDDVPKNTYICEVCHTRTEFHRQGGTGTDHNNGRKCPDCHTHDKGWAPYEKCTECHAVARNYVYNVRQIVAGPDGTGGDFVKLSRHVSNGTDEEIVTPYDCAVCHREASYSNINNNLGYKDPPLHNNGSTSTTRMVDLRNVDSPDTGWQWNKNVVDETMRTNMDTFCMTCHDADGAAGIAVNAGDNGLSTTHGGGSALALHPFNSNDTIRNGRDGFTTRTRVVDVKSQFFAGSGGVGAGYNGNPSQHAVRGGRYGSNNAGWTAAAWTTHVNRKNQTMNAAGVREQATLHCSDCHLIEKNAHGATNAWHMLLNGTINNYTTDYDMGGKLMTDFASIVCYKCHNSNTYKNGATGGGSRINHGLDTNAWAGTYGGRVSKSSYLGPGCLLCHSGDGFGRIHGRGSATDGDNGTYSASGGTYSKYRFMPGSYMLLRPNNAVANDTAWDSAGGAQPTCYFAGKTNSWMVCGQHGAGGQEGRISTTNYQRSRVY